MRRHMGIAPAPAFQIGPIAFRQLQQRIVQRQTGDVSAGFHRRRLNHIAPDRGACRVAVDPFDEQRLGVNERIGQRAKLIPRQAFLQRTQPCFGDQRFGQMFVHLAVPLGQQGQRALAQTFGGAFGGRFTGKPQIGPDQRQQAAGGGRNRIQLRLDKALAGMHRARLHQRQPALDALRIAPVKADMVGEGAVHRLVVGIAQKAAHRVHKARVAVIGQHPGPAVGPLPSRGGHPSLGAVAGVAGGHGADQLQRDAVFIGQHQVLRRRHKQPPGLDRLGHRGRSHQPHRRRHRGVLPRKRRPFQRRHMARWRDRSQIIMAAGQHRAAFGPALNDGHRRFILDGQNGAAGDEGLWPRRRQVFFRVVGVHLLDHHILIVQVRGGQPPAQLFRPSGQHHRHPRNRAANHPARRQLQPRQIPDRRRGQPQMRVIGQKAAARR